MCSVCITAGIAVSLLALGTSTPTLEQIHAKWRHRTEQSHSMRLTWEESRGSTTVPAVQLTFGRLPGQLQLRDETTAAGGNGTPYLSTFDGTHGKGYFPGAIGRPGTGVIWPKGDVNLFQLPVIQTLRPLEPGLQDLTLDKYVLTDRTTDINGVQCLVLEEPMGARSPGLRSEVFVDPARDFVPCQYVESVQEKVAAEYTCEFQQQPNGVYLPFRWEARFGDSERVVAQVTNIELDLALNESEFSLPFPPNTIVSDKIRDEEYYIDASGQMTSRQAPGPARQVTKPGVNRDWLWGSLMAAGLLAGLVVMAVRYQQSVTHRRNMR